MKPVSHTARLAPVAFLFAAFLPVAGLGAQSSEASDSVIIENGEGSGQAGRLAINIAAGTLNQQASSVVLAQGQIAATSESLVQHSEAQDASDRSTRIVIADGAFSGHSGLASINVTAGTGNQSANLASLAIGQEAALSDQFLEQTRAPIEPSGGSGTTASGPNDFVDIDDGAFARGSGVFQANLIGGERNSSANTFSLAVTAGGQP